MKGDCLNHIAYPLGGIGAGMICLEGAGALSKFSLRHRPNLTTEYNVYAALAIRGRPQAARVLEGSVPAWKLRPHFSGPINANWGLPRFREASFEARFPFATVRLQDEALPIEVELTGWSPFSPGDADNASLPVAGLEYRFVNRGDEPLDAVFSFNAENFMAVPVAGCERTDRIVPTSGGFILTEAGSRERPWDEGYCAVWVEESGARVDPVWFRGERTDQPQMLWHAIAAGRCEARDADPDRYSPGASIFVPFRLGAGETKVLPIRLAWYVPKSDLCEPSFKLSWEEMRSQPIPLGGRETYRPWYAGRFASIKEVKRYWQSDYERLRPESERFSRAFYDSTLPPEVLDAVAANLAILKSPTVMRQADGRFWGWEGVNEEEGSCYGSSNHVWNYAQAMAHLFPQLERTMRETELNENLGKDGFQAIRAALPIRPIGDAREDAWGFGSAADGQLGTVIKLYRDWCISGDTEWLRSLWPKVRLNLDYCIRTWDPKHRGWLEEPHVTTYDRDFWGADSFCTSLYAAALKSATLMGRALGERVDDYDALLTQARKQLEEALYNGEYFIQRTEWRSLQARFPPEGQEPLAQTLRRDPEMLDVAHREGPPYQYGEGCLADGVMGAWLAWAAGIDEILDATKVESHLTAVHRHNFKQSLTEHANAARSVFASAEEAGLIMCTWPRGGRPTIPPMFVDEVWTGIEYEVSSHLIAIGKVEQGLEIVRACRQRYDGRARNPFAEVEAGHWYARAMASYALLQALSGARYDAVDQVLYLKPAIKGDFRSFLSTATGFGTVGVKSGEPFLEVVSGRIPYRKIHYQASGDRY